LSAFTSSANLQRLFAAGLPTYVDPARAIYVAAALHRVALARATCSWRARPNAVDLAVPAALDEAGLLDFFARHGVPCIVAARVTTADDAVAAATRMGFPVALKVSLPGLAHKADIGGVAVGLRDAEAVRQAFSRIAGAVRDRGESVAFAATVQPMARGHREMMFGFRRDPVFGPVVLLGFGGAWVEVVDDVVLRLAPVDTQDAHAMIDGLRGRALLDGARGQPPADVAALASALAAFSRVASRLPAVASVDLNPVIVGRPGEGAVAVDAKLARAH
jgi:acyl-CoA synthetase (NDP forming)